MEKQLSTINFVDEARLERNGQVYWNPSQSYPDGHFDASLQVFDRARVLVRSRTSNELPPARNRLPANVEVGEFPYYIGAAGALRCSNDLLKVTRYWANREQYLVLRGPGFLSFLVAFWRRQAGRPYAVEVLGDSRDVFRVIQHPLSGVWRVLFSSTATQIIRHASSVLYVADYLQARYPAGEHAATTVASDVRLYPAVFADPHTYSDPPRPLRVATVGNMEQVYKGYDYLLEAIALCARQNFRVEAHLIGEGRLRPQYERLAGELGIADAVKFCGSVLWGPDLFRILDAADLYVQCSLTEGLPKALAEAMARGLPAIGTQVGGIPELLTPDVLVAPASAEELACKLMELGQAPARLAQLAHSNHAHALKYRIERLEAKRQEFYHDVQRTLSPAM